MCILLLLYAIKILDNIKIYLRDVGSEWSELIWLTVRPSIKPL
jgi:hypothetical protein